MANAYSVARQYNEYISPVNLGLLNTTLQSLDGKYSANMAKVDALIETTVNMPLVREEDKKILYQNLLSLDSEINTFSKMQLTSPDTLRSIQSSIQSAITPYIAEQFKNSQKILNFQKEMVEKREKNPELYNDDNYQYTLDQAGYTNYLRGFDENGNKVDALKGELLYNDYYDPQKNLIEPMQKHFKEFGYETYVDQSQPSGLLIVSKKGERLEESTIRQYIDSKLASDPRLQKQFEINAYSSYRGLTDSEFMQNWSNNLKTKKDSYDKAINLIDEKLAQTSENHPNYQYYQNQKTVAESELKETQDIIDGRINPSRRQIEFKNYIDNYKNSVAKTFAYDRIDKIDYSNTPLELAKFELEKEKLRVKQAGRTTSSDFTIPGQVGGAGVAYDLPPNGDTTDIEKTVPQEVQEIYERASADFAKEIARTDEKWATYTPQQRTDKLNAVGTALKEGILAEQSKYSAETINKAMTYMTARETNLKFRRDINTRWLPRMEQTYDMLFNNKGTSELNLQNLSTTLPNTVGYIRQGKDLSQLTTDEKRLVVAELSNNIIKNSNLSGEAIDELKTFNHNFKSGLEGSYLEDYNRASEINPPTFLDNFSIAGQRIANTAGSLFDVIRTPFEGTFAAISQGRQAYDDVNRRYDERQAERGRLDTQLIRQSQEALSSPFQQDRNLSELQGRDLNGTKGFTEILGEWVTADRTTRPTREVYLPTARAQQGVSFNPNVDSDKNYVQAIKSTVMAETGLNVAKESTYRTWQDDENVYMQVTVEKPQMGGKANDVVKRILTTETISVRKDRVPPALSRRLGTQENPILNSKNQNVPDTKLKYSLPGNAEERVSKINGYLNGMGRNLSNYERDTAFSQGFMTSAEEIVAPYINRIRTKDQEQRVTNLINSDFGATVKSVGGQGFQVILNVNDKSTGVASPVINEYDISKFTFQLDQLVKSYLNSNIEQIVKNNGQTL